MLAGISIRDIVLVDKLDLEIGPGLTVLTGETGAGKSIILDALGLALGARSEARLVRQGAERAQATAIFTLAPGHAAFAVLSERGVEVDPGEDLILRRQVGLDGRSRAYVNDQPVAAGVLKAVGELLVEVHGQHETVGLLDPKTHRALLDAFAGCEGPLKACGEAYRSYRTLQKAYEALQAEADQARAHAEDLELRLADLRQLNPKAGEEDTLAALRGLLGAAEKTLADIDAAKSALGEDVVSNGLGQALRAAERARDRLIAAGAGTDDARLVRILNAVAALERALIETEESVSALDAAAEVFDFDPEALEKSEERLFALRAAARKYSLTPDELPLERGRIEAALALIEDQAGALSAAKSAAAAGFDAYRDQVKILSQARAEAGTKLAAAVMAELAPLKLEKAKFRVTLEALPPERWTADGGDRVAFEVQTNAGAPFGPLDAIASGGELARFALALKASLAASAETQSCLIFDEVDQGVGGAVADAVGHRLKRLSGQGQVLVVTHSPQVAARGDHHLRVSKSEVDGVTRTQVVSLDKNAREEEVARMLSGADISEAARAAARALIQA